MSFPYLSFYVTIALSLMSKAAVHDDELNYRTHSALFDLFAIRGVLYCKDEVKVWGIDEENLFK